MDRIIEFYAENFKRLRYVNFKPTGRMTIFTGKNSQGKTSALDALTYALCGKKYSPDMPTRKGATHHKVKLGIKGDKGVFIVTRTQSGLKVEPESGKTQWWTTPQAMLDSIFDELSIDPIEFIRMGSDTEGKRRQVDLLRKAVLLNVDLDELRRLNETDFKTRRDVNREVDRLKGEIAAIPIQDGLPNYPIDIGAIQARIKEATEHNRTILQQIEARTALVQQLADAEMAEKRNNELIANTHTKIESVTAELEAIAPAGKKAAEIRDLLEELRDRSDALPQLPHIGNRLSETISNARTVALEYIPRVGARQTDLNADLDNARKTLKAAEKDQKRLSANVAEAQAAVEQAPKPAMVDTSTLTEELTQAQVVNREIEKRDRRDVLNKQLQDKVGEANTLTRAMEQREEKKNSAIAGAKMPIDGLTFTTEQGKEEILFNGVPIAQLGEAEQLRISISVALARNPQLRIVRIPHGEALDEDSMVALGEMAEAMDFYVWMAKVDTTGKMGIYLEDGEVKAINEIPNKGGTA